MSIDLVDNHWLLITYYFIDPFHKWLPIYSYFFWNINSKTRLIRLNLRLANEFMTSSHLWKKSLMTFAWPVRWLSDVLLGSIRAGIRMIKKSTHGWWWVLLWWGCPDQTAANPSQETLIWLFVYGAVLPLPLCLLSRCYDWITHQMTLT